jgi:hypothetical protein
VTALVSADQSATTVALPEYRAYIQAKKELCSAIQAESVAHDAAFKARDARIIAEQDLKRAQEDLDLAIEETLK